jgi:hypothetical protein
MRASRKGRCGLMPLLDIDAVLRIMGLPRSALGRSAIFCSTRAAGRYLAARYLPARGDSAPDVSAFDVSPLDVSILCVSALGSTIAGRSVYFGVSAACGASAVRGTSVVFEGAGALCFSTPDSDKLRSAPWAVAEARTKPAIKINLRMMRSPLELSGRLRMTAGILCAPDHAARAVRSTAKTKYRKQPHAK